MTMGKLWVPPMNFIHVNTSSKNITFNPRKKKRKTKKKKKEKRKIGECEKKTDDMSLNSNEKKRKRQQRTIFKSLNYLTKSVIRCISTRNKER